MRLIIIQFNYNHLGGSAFVRVGHDEKLSAFDQPSYLGVDCGFHVVPRPADDLPDNHVLVQVPGTAAWLNLCILAKHPVNWPSGVEQPQIGAYKLQIARLISNMIANATLSDLDDQIPTVLVPGPNR
ncbi:hypothetical protein LJR034_009043 [Caballeronia sp. LjRoot34]|uniref:hypothetical protein n=1 Tax=Caballeronia sp. LjRoot34 TaxID=3342325 RepID=UPI003ECF4644